MLSNLIVSVLAGSLREVQRQAASQMNPSYYHYHLWSVCLQALSTLTHDLINLLSTLHWFYYSHFTDKETEA